MLQVLCIPKKLGKMKSLEPGLTLIKSIKKTDITGQNENFKSSSSKGRRQTLHVTMSDMELFILFYFIFRKKEIMLTPRNILELFFTFKHL